MKNKYLNDLEFYEITKRIKKYCPEISYLLIDRLSMYSSLDDLKSHFNRLLEMSELNSNGDIVTELTAKPLNRLNKLEIADFVFEISELADIRNNLKISGNIIHYFKKTNMYSELKKVFNSLFYDEDLIRKLNSIINKNDELREDATPELSKIFSEERMISRKIEDFYSRMFKTSKWSRMFMEEIVTFRNGRKVVLIKKEFKNQFPGVIHGESASGETIFMEPLDALIQNNRLRELEILKEHEINKLLRKMSISLSNYIDELRNNQDLLAYWEYLNGLCTFMEIDNAIIPSLNNKGIISIINAIHPLIKKKAVPINIKLGDGYSSLIISGPNAGGKTVALKTLGLFVCMAMCGIPVHASFADICFISRICVDIGDKQSIENNLSTFTSHIDNLKEILSNINNKSLILIDEIGSGSSPEESQALACSILKELSLKGCLTAVTTHYRAVIEFAEKSDDMLNASLEFDHEKLIPTFNIVYGKPGFSFGLKIAEKYGLPVHIIKRAKEYIDTTFLIFNEKIKNLEIKEAKARELKEKYQKLYSEYSDKSKELDEKIYRFKSESKEKIRKLLERKEKEIDSIKEELRNELRKVSFKKGKGEHILREKINKYKKIIRDEKREDRNIDYKLIVPGARIRIYESKSIFKIDEVKEGRIYMSSGNVKMSCSFEEVVEIVEKLKNNDKMQVNISSQIISKKAVFKPEIDVRGKRREEALSMVDKLISDAVAVDYDKVSIIHGRGTYILKKSISEFLRENKNVKSFKDAEYNDGGSGKTIVILKA